MISFILNNKIVECRSAEGGTLLDYIRYDACLKGTKIGCREGDCGACTVLVGSIEEGKLSYISMTSCLTPLGNLPGKHVLTVEGINMTSLSPVQLLMLENNGTQCGFCTTGFVMSLTGFVLSSVKPTEQASIKSIDGNICRCTGYKSIERAAAALTKKLLNRPEGNTLSWLIENGFIPEYFSDIKSRLIALSQQYPYKPSNSISSNKTIIGGGTDLMVQQPEAIRALSTENVLQRRELKDISVENSICRVGAAVTVNEFNNSEIIKHIFPRLDSYIKLVSSSPIRNMATLGGNLVNASPIGDMTIFFLALGSNVVLNDDVSRRSIPLKELFLDYKKLDKKREEYIEVVEFNIPSNNQRFNFEKVSKRTHLDIASVNSACLITLNEDGSIQNAQISAGGVGPIPKYLDKTSAFLINKKIDLPVLSQLMNVIGEEIAPISDARGKAGYKKFLLEQLILSHLIEALGQTDSLLAFMKTR